MTVEPITQSPQVAMDEAGNTGENLLDLAQPVFALAAVHLPRADAQQAVAAALGRTQMPELKFAALARSNSGRRNILALLADAALTPENAAVGAAHKPWLLAGKLVDELIEPTMLARGLQVPWYASGDHLTMVGILYERGKASLGDLYDELVRAFVELVRHYTAPAAREFVRVLRRCRILSRDPALDAVLGLMLDTQRGLESEFRTRTDALDPALPLLWAQGAHWSELLGRPFEFVHDDSNTVERWKDRIIMVERLAQDAAADSDSGEAMGPVRRSFHGIEAEFPVGLQRITFAQSHRDPVLQIADVLAGASAYMLAIVSGIRQPEPFARDLFQLGLPSLVMRWLGPDFDQTVLAALR